MTDPTRLTDDQIAGMLADRVASPMPADLQAVVVSRVRDARVDKGSVQHRGQSPRGVLLVAAALVVGGTALAIGWAGSQGTAPPAATPAAAIAQGSPAATGTPSSPSPSATEPARTSCGAFDRAALTGGVGTGLTPVPGVAPEIPRSGPVILLGGASASPETFDPLTTSPSPAPIAEWNLDSFAVNHWNPSMDGTAVAVELGEQQSCPSDVFVMRSDGTGLRRPFASPDHDAYSPAWSPAGRLLAVVTAPWSADGQPTETPLAHLLVWDAETDKIVDLGRPCERCRPVGGVLGGGTMVWSPDGYVLALDYTNLGCGVASPAPGDTASCRGIALVSPQGQWQPVSIADDGGGTLYTLVGWADDRTLLVERNGELARVDLASSIASPIKASVSGGMWPLSRALSPDRTLILQGSDGNQPFVTVINLKTGRSTQSGPVPPDVLDFSWSPDSRWILAQADTDGYGANRGLYLLRADGSEPGRQVLPGAFGTMAWLPAAP